MNLRQLRYFLRVVELGSMTSASKDLHVAQPALGLQIRQLEDEFGVALLNRHSRGVEATEAGTLLYERATRLLELASEVRAEVLAFAGGDQIEKIRLGMTPSITAIIGSDLLVMARDSLPNVSLLLVEELSFSLIETLDRGEIDLALAYEVADRPGLIRRPIFEEELLFLVAPDQAPAAAEISFADAVKFDLVFPSERDLLFRLVADAASRASLPFRPTYMAQSVPAMTRLIEKGIAASIMPFGTAIEQTEKGSLVTRRVVGPTLSRILYLTRPTRRGRFRNEQALDTFLTRALERLADRLGPLARPFRTAPAPVPEWTDPSDDT